MADTYSALNIHFVFGTKNRTPWLDKDVRPRVWAFMGGIARENGMVPIQIGGVADHVHLFFRLSRTRTMAEVVETVKTSSSKWSKTKGSRFSAFHWQSGYGAFSVSQSDADAVIAFIRNQPEHHTRVWFQEEYRRFLDRYQIPYDERYVWD
jgi:putative transposase